jgi:hypothetical protein
MFICDLLNDTASYSDHIASNDAMINELETVRKDVIVA